MPRLNDDGKITSQLNKVHTKRNRHATNNALRKELILKIGKLKAKLIHLRERLTTLQTGVAQTIEGYQPQDIEIKNVPSLLKHVKSLLEQLNSQRIVLQPSRGEEYLLQIKNSQGIEESGIIGIVGRLATVKDPQVNKAVSIALGEQHLRLVVVQDLPTSRKWKVCLEQEGMNGASFLILNSLVVPGALDERSNTILYYIPPDVRKQGLIGLAVNLLQFSKGTMPLRDLRSMFYSLLGNTLVFDRASEAHKFRKDMLQKGIAPPKIICLSGRVIGETGLESLPVLPSHCRLGPSLTAQDQEQTVAKLNQLLTFRKLLKKIYKISKQAYSVQQLLRNLDKN